MPIVDKETSHISEWATVTYAQFHQDVELYARYWTSALSAKGIAPDSVIGLWYVSHLVLAYDPCILTTSLIQGSVVPRTPMCFTSTELAGRVTSLKCLACASPTLSSSSNSSKELARALWFANHRLVSTFRNARSQPIQPSTSGNRMQRTFPYLHSGQTTPHPILYSYSTRVDRQAAALNSSHAIGDGSTASLRNPSKSAESFRLKVKMSRQPCTQNFPTIS